MRPLYQRYHDVKAELDTLQLSVEGGNGSGGVSSNQLNQSIGSVLGLHAGGGGGRGGNTGVTDSLEFGSTSSSSMMIQPPNKGMILLVCFAYLQSSLVYE